MNRFDVAVGPEDLDLALCVSSGQVFRWDRLDDGRWLGVDGPSWFLVEPGDGALAVESNQGEAAFERFFRLEVDLTAVAAEIERADGRLKSYIASLPGLRVLRPSDPAEVLFTFLCTANNHMARIKRMVGSLAAFGQPIDEAAGRTIMRFPSVERLASIEEADLRARGFGYRGATVPAAARWLLTRPEAWLTGLASLPYDEAVRALCAIPGVGPKIADCVCLFGLGFMEAAPVDTHLWQACCRLYRPEWTGKSLTHRRYQEAGDLLRGKFGPLTGWAHQYLFYDNALRWRNRRRATSGPGRRAPCCSG